jgi:hypothetical protein
MGVDGVPSGTGSSPSRGVRCLGGEFQFRLPDATCEMYWLSVDPAGQFPDEPWPAYVARSCADTRAAFHELAGSTDFRAEAMRWEGVPELSAAGAKPESYLCFVAYFVAEQPAPNDSSKPTPLRGAA